MTVIESARTFQLHSGTLPVKLRLLENDFFVSWLIDCLISKKPETVNQIFLDCSDAVFLGYILHRTLRKELPNHSIPFYISGCGKSGWQIKKRPMAMWQNICLSRKRPGLDSKRHSDPVFFNDLFYLHRSRFSVTHKMMMSAHNHRRWDFCELFNALITFRTAQSWSFPQSGLEGKTNSSSLPPGKTCAKRFLVVVVQLAWR